jgi:hypothetical protein
MGKMTFVVDYPDGQEPAVSAATDILGGKLLSFAFKDTSEDYTWRSVSEVQPPEGEYVFVHDGDDASVGCSVASEWRNAKGCGYLYPITYWMPIPEIE